jgi:hypothetical protein
MSEPVRLCDAITALLPALRPASGPGAGHRPVMRAVICCANAKEGGPPIAAALPGHALEVSPLARQEGRGRGPLPVTGQARGGGRHDSAR